MSVYFLSDEAKLVFQSNGPKTHFFGYYDKCPWDFSGTRILCHRANHKIGLLEEQDFVDVGYFLLNDAKFHTIATTNACNWQQGSMLQWLPDEYNSKIIYNIKTQIGFRSVIHNLQTDEKCIVNRPIYTIHRSGNFALGLNMERLYFTRRAYGYSGFVSQQWGKRIVHDDGIYLIDLRSNKSKLLIRTSDIANRNSKQIMRNAVHWLDHPMFNPRGNRFLFHHRWTSKTGGFFSRLYSADLNGKALHMFPDSGMYSHANWINENEFCVFGRIMGSDVRTSEKASLKKYFVDMLTPLYHKGKRLHFIRRIRDHVVKDYYIRFRDGDNNFSIIGKDCLKTDGHPSISPTNPNLLLTDTYPDSADFRHLHIYNINQNILHEIGRFKSPPGHNSSSPIRCDLHPRWDRIGKQISIDSMHEGKRQIYTFGLSEKLLVS